MANCVQCGRELPSFSFGDTSDTCKDCRQRTPATAPQEVVFSPAPPVRKPTLADQARAFPITAAIVGINVAVYIACVIGSYLSHQGNAMDFTTSFVLRWGADYGPLTLNGQWWRAFTSMWLHGGLIHVGANMYCFWMFGRIAERIYGRGRYLAIYLITGLGSSLASLAWHPNTVSVGASGAIFGVAGALFIPFLRKKLALPPAVMKSMLRDIGFFIVLNLIIGASISFIDNSAHVGGLIVGLILGEVFVRLVGAGVDVESSLRKVVAVSAILIVSLFQLIRYERLPATYADSAIYALLNGDSAKAETMARQAVAAYPNDPQVHAVLGEVYLHSSKYSDAAKEFESAQRFAPDDRSLAGRLGAAYAGMHDWQRAEPQLLVAVNADPKDVDALTDLGLTLAATNRVNEGVDYIRKALQIDPKLARAQYALGAILSSQGKYDEALAPLREAVRLNPADDGYRKALAAAEKATSGSSR